MQNENDYLEAVNDLRDQYNDMKKNYDIKLAVLKQENERLKIELNNKPVLRYDDFNQFTTTRPFARTPVYSYY